MLLLDPDYVDKAQAHRASVHACDASPVMTTLRKMSDFVYFLPFLFSMYHYPEPSGTFYGNPHTSVMTHI